MCIRDSIDMVDAKNLIHELISATNTEVQNGRNPEETASLVMDSLKGNYENWWGFETLSFQIPMVYEKLSK